MAMHGPQQRQQQEKKQNLCHEEPIGDTSCRSTVDNCHVTKVTEGTGTIENNKLHSFPDSPVSVIDDKGNDIAFHIMTNIVLKEQEEDLLPDDHDSSSSSEECSFSDFKDDDDDSEDSNDSFAATCNFQDSVEDMGKMMVGIDESLSINARNASSHQSYYNVSTYISDDDDEIATDDSSASLCSSFDFDTTLSDSLNHSDFGEHDEEDEADNTTLDMESQQETTNIVSLPRHVRFGTVTIRTYSVTCQVSSTDNMPKRIDDITIDIVGYESIRSYLKACRKQRKVNNHECNRRESCYGKSKRHYNNNNNNNNKQVTATATRRGTRKIANRTVSV